MTGEFGNSQFVSSNNANANASCSASRWLTEEVFKLIDVVQRDEAIYNPRHKYYFCRPYVENFWREVDLKLEKNPGASLAKWTNLRISFRREYTNYLEEKVPPCWSYFDRMFFLHPYLRKKHQQPKSLDTQVQDALAHLSSLSNRMQRERTVTTIGTTTSSTNQPTPSSLQSPQPQPLDNYLDYFDENEPNNSELEDLIEEEGRNRYHSQLDSNDIKSECEEPVDDFEQGTPDHDEDEPEDHEMHKMAPTSSVAAAATSSAAEAHRRYAPQQPHTNRVHHNRLQLRLYPDEVRASRPRSQELPPTAAAAAATVSGVNFPAQPTTHLNISFVRPTFSKPVDLVSTTTHSGGALPVAPSEMELPTPSNLATGATPMAGTMASSSSGSYLSQRHLHGHHQAAPSSLRLEANNSAGPVANGGGGVVDLCDCKTDSDAMFLMSLLPDIQKLNGRDRGKIKIAFQNILQDYLYPD
ncbi:uncharacterized protein LOC111065839 [Drosophila obscura]|uniref:uncharacterized protein LOC111065839 n=1 Tax=Drosophila obscura TaxID=7282 RepID=UPI001BB0E3CA|nr:uncharacterized protein LOC111065839 [Drosophila obscura]